jgi:hypothetical protein
MILLQTNQSINLSAITHTPGNLIKVTFRITSILKARSNLFIQKQQQHNQQLEINELSFPDKGKQWICLAISKQ